MPSQNLGYIDSCYTYLTGGTDYQDIHMFARERGKDLDGLLQLPNGHPLPIHSREYSSTWMLYPYGNHSICMGGSYWIALKKNKVIWMVRSTMGYDSAKSPRKIMVGLQPVLTAICRLEIFYRMKPWQHGKI